MKKTTLYLLFFFMLSSYVVAQQRTITGNVVDDTNLPLTGVTVQLKNTAIGVITDFDGNYSITIPKDKNTLVFSYLGYTTKEIEVGTNNVVNVALVSKIEKLKDVVVIGYGEVNKADITGAITSIKPSDASKNQAQGIENLLQGKAAGVVVSSTGFEPTAPINIKIRGVNSLANGTQPLYVVDGIIVNSSDERDGDPLSGGNSYLSPQNGLAGINPKDIESIEILKDASATAIYGSRASNGVILITTKKGKSGKTVFTYNGTTRIAEITRPIEVLEATEFAEYQNKSRALKGFAPNFTIDQNGNVFDATTGDYLQPVNWSDETYKTAVSYSHRLTASGGNDNNKFYFGAGNVNTEGIIPNSFARQTDFTVNLSNTLTDRLTLDSKIALTFTKSSASKGTENLGSTTTNMVRQIINSAPYLGFSANNSDNGNYDNSTDGPRAWIKDYDDVSDEIRGLGSLKLEYRISDVFKYRILTGLDYRTKERKIWYGTSLFRGKLANGEAGISNLDRFRYNIDNTLMFSKKFNKNHRINGTIGIVMDEVLFKSTAIEASDFVIKDLRADGISYGQVYSPIRYYKEGQSLLSFIGRANYTLFNKINLTATLRADGSSKFDPNNRWGYFPAFAGAYQLHREKFLKNYSNLSEAKIRLGWGITGNQNTSPYQYFVTYTNTANNYFDQTGTSSQTALIPSNIANVNLKWETTYQSNIGVDLGFYDNRFTASIDYYNKETNDLLTRLPLPGSAGGFDFISANIGTLQNKGLEFTLSADIIKKDKLRWNVYGNYSTYRNKITKLGLPAASWGGEQRVAYAGGQVSGGTYFKTFANVYMEGQPAGMFWGFETNGIIDTAEELASAPTSINGTNTTPQLGDLLVVDRNGDGIITDEDKTFIGNPNPDFTYGFGTTLEYKNFSINAYFNGVYGNDIANGNLIRESYADGSGNLNIRKEAYYNAWSTENPNGTYPRINYDLQDEIAFSDRMVEDGSFLRLQNVTLGYRIPFKDESLIEAIDVSVSGYNLLLFTNYSGYDPEVDSFSFDNNRSGIDWQSFPNQRAFSFGLNVTF